MDQDTSSFQQEYSRLNREQKEAVDTIEGPVMVIAGPGTGKTQILTLRIAHILLTTQINPDNILALTFTQAAAANMRDRLSKIVGAVGHSVNIYTFHAFCSQIIENNPDDFWGVLGKKVADDIERVEIIESVFDRESFVHIKPYGRPHYYVPDAMRALSDLKREGVSPDEFIQMVERQQSAFDSAPDKLSTKVEGRLKGTFQTQLKRIEKNRELATVYRAYQELMHERDLYDYDDLIMLVLEKLRSDEDLRLRQMERYQYILVDEHQDSNNAQNKILSLLTSFDERPNIFVVGDEKQAIFRFQGASVENFHQFSRHHPDAKLIRLVQNYRSTQTILDSAVALLDAQDQELKSQVTHAARPIEIVEAQTIDDEMEMLATRIKQDISRGIAPDAITVLTRTRELLREVERVLLESDIPTYLDMDIDIFRSRTVTELLTLLRAVHMFAAPEYLFPALHLGVFGLDPLGLYKLTRAVSRKRMGLEDVLSDRSRMEQFGIEQAETMHGVFKRIGQWHTLSHSTPISSLLHTIVEESGLLKHFLKTHNPIVAIAPLRELYDNIQSLDREGAWRLADLFTYVDKLQEHRLTVRAKIRTSQRGKVQIMTAHGAKGLEFDHVYIPFAQEGVWGGRKRPKLFHLPAEVYVTQDDSDDDDDELRLLFVAITRARREVCISYSSTKRDGSPAVRSGYIAQIQPHLSNHTILQRSEQHTASSPFKPDPSSMEQFETFVRASFASYGLSVSALNNYLHCPWRYFYINLVRVPSGKDKVLMFGNAIHNALTVFLRHYKEKGDLSCDYLLESFDKYAHEELFTIPELNEAIVRGKHMLMHYFKAHEETFSRNIQVKVRIPEVTLPAVDIEGIESIKLTGEIDLVEYLDSTLTGVRVVDFKTGKPKSRGDIQGETKGSDGNYYRQLVFYKLLLRYFRPQWVVREGMLDFVESDSRGAMHREKFEIDDGEVGKLLQVIQSTARDVCTLGFWNRKCDDTECEWCALRDDLEYKIFEGGLF